MIEEMKVKNGTATKQELMNYVLGIFKARMIDTGLDSELQAKANDAVFAALCDIIEYIKL